MNAPLPPPPYAMLDQYESNRVRPPPPLYRRNLPLYNPNYSQKRSASSCCFRCICCFFLFLIIILSFLTVYFYTVFHPEVPAYNVQALEVKAFDVQPDFSLNNEFLVTVKAENPNNNIGFIYGKDSYVIVTYTDTTLCTGKIPSFYHGHNNITIVKVGLNGKSEFGSGLQEAYTESNKIHRIPLLIQVKVPVIVVVGEYPLRQCPRFSAFMLVIIWDIYTQFPC